MITVYHLADNIDHNDLVDIVRMSSLATVLMEKMWRGGAYQPVATLETNDLNIAWRQTNNIDDSWVENEGILDLFGNVHAYGRRSSQIGDIMQRDGVLYVVARMGFEKLPFTVADWMVH